MRNFIFITIVLLGSWNKLMAHSTDSLFIQFGDKKLHADHLVKGELNLYVVAEYAEEINAVNDNYYQKRKVAYNSYYLEVNKNLIHIHASNYKRVIKKYLPNAPDLHKRLGKLGFRFENIQYMIEFYNKFRVNEDALTFGKE